MQQSSITTNYDPLGQIPQWKRVLYYIQLQAPKPKKVECFIQIPNKPPYYGTEFHGKIDRHAADELLVEDGCYLVRESQRQNEGYTLVIKFNNQTKNYKLFYDEKNCQHYVGDKNFDSLDDLVADGLICFYVHLKAPEYIASLASESHYEESPYMRYREHMREQQQHEAERNAMELQRESRRLAQPPAGSLITSDSPTNQPAIPPRPVSLRSSPQQPSNPPQRDGPELFRASSSVKMADEWMNIIQQEKPHNFKLTTFKSLASCWCEYCLHFMWGLIQQGVECQDCGLRTHKKCSEKVGNDCLPDMKMLKRMFALDLTTLLKATNKSIPYLVEKCILEIETRGMKQEGLYRVNGFHDDIEDIRRAFDLEGDVDLSEARCPDINTVTSVLKLFFRLLPVPLITFDVYPKLLTAVSKPDSPPAEQIANVKNAISLLPPAHIQTLKYLVCHLNRVIQMRERTMMSAENLAIVFAPTIMQSPQSDPMKAVACGRIEQKALEILISNYHHVFER